MTSSTTGLDEQPDNQTDSVTQESDSIPAPPPAPRLASLHRPALHASGASASGATIVPAPKAQAPRLDLSHLKAIDELPLNYAKASQAITDCLSARPEIHYALVGGACLIAMGSNRSTLDVDVVIAPPSLLIVARGLLRADARFKTESKTRHTTFIAFDGLVIEVDLLSSPGTFRAPFDATSTVMVTSTGIRLLNLETMLESECAAISNRAQEAKRRSDADDILFILGIAAQQHLRFSSEHILGASVEFQSWLSHLLGEEVLRHFAKVGL